MVLAPAVLWALTLSTGVAPVSAAVTSLPYCPCPRCTFLASHLPVVPRLGPPGLLSALTCPQKGAQKTLTG